jgi:tetratricopeptide (TPR) repeat protein
MKAFLSHSSKDKELVESVANELGRQFCVYDKRSFETGIEFQDSIKNGLDESALFVLFASTNSLESVWVEFEITEAWYRKLNKSLRGAVVYIIDSAVRLDQVPEWLRRARIQVETVPKRLARDIRFHINELQLERRRPYFVGRTEDLRDLEETLTPIYGPAPRVICIVGLPGIGRRSLIREKTPSVLNLRKQIEIRIDEGDLVNDICLKLADVAEPYSTEAGYKKLIDEIKKLAEPAALQRVMTDIRSLVAGGELPIFVDTGGLLDDDGKLSRPIQNIIKAFEPADSGYLFLVTQRRPGRMEDYTLPIHMLKPLENRDMQRLLATLATNSDLVIPPAVIEDLSTFVAGYPPAAYFAVQQIRDYGLDLVVKEKSQLVQFTTSVFLRHLTELILTETEVSILRLLGLFSPLPLPVIANAVGVNLEEVDEQLIHLIDLALVTPTPAGHYRIADPVANAAIRSFGFPTKDAQERVAANLSGFLTATDVENSRFELSRVLFRASVLAGNTQLTSQAEFVASDIIGLAATSYHQRNYEESERLGYEAVALRPDSISARQFLVRALIQREKWDYAEEQIDELEKIANPRVVLFLRGFLKRRRGNLKDALELFNRAAEEGRDDAALNRELALCYYRSGDPEKAFKHVRHALEKEGNNWYLLDLLGQISISLGDKRSAEEALKRLELVADESQYYHRVSTYRQAFGDPGGALEASRRAVEVSDDPVFEVLSKLVYLEIVNNNLQEARKVLARLDGRFSIRKDIRMGLRCRLEIADHNFKSALAQSMQIKDQTSPFYKRIRLDGLKGELMYSAMPDEQRLAYEREVEGLKEDLRELSDVGLHDVSLFPLD